MKKHVWRKDDKALYIAKKKPAVLDIGPMNYLTIEGKGNPNGERFSELVGALYAYSYTLKMLPKKGITPEGYFDYTVFPLEGFWSAEKPIERGEDFDLNDLTYKIMIRQPDFVTRDLLESIKEQIDQKVAKDIQELVEFETIEEGLNVQALHIGPYATEKETFRLIDEFIQENEYQYIGHTHKEIYLSDPRRSSPETMKTVLRMKVKR